MRHRDREEGVGKKLIYQVATLRRLLDIRPALTSVDIAIRRDTRDPVLAKLQIIINYNM